MHVPFAGTGSASAFPAPSAGKAPAFSPALRRHLFGTPPASFRHPAGTFPAPFRAPSAGIFRAPLRHFFRRSAGTQPAPSAGISRAPRRHLFRHLSGHRSGIFSDAPQVPGRRHRRLPPASSRAWRPADAPPAFSGAPQAPSSPNLPSRLLRHRRHPAEAPSRSGRTDLGSAAEGPRNQLQKRLSCSGSITSSTSPLARSISKSTPPPPVLGRPVVEISPPRGSAARRLPVWAPVEAPV